MLGSGIGSMENTMESKIPAI